MRVSVVIPARNEERWLPRCLRSLARQLRPPDEVIVVDNGSSDGTAQVARAFGCRVVWEPVPGVGRARAAGCRAATGEVIATTDADTVVPRQWVATIAATLAARSGCVAVTGPWLLADGPAWQRWSVAVHGRLLQRGFAFLAPPLVNLSGCNSAFRAAAYWAVGGFRPDLHLGEDLDLSLRLRALGHVRFCADLVVHTSARRLTHSFLGTLGRYTWDTARQLTPYLLGRRPAVPPAEPSATPRAHT